MHAIALLHSVVMSAAAILPDLISSETAAIVSLMAIPLLTAASTLAGCRVTPPRRPRPSLKSSLVVAAVNGLPVVYLAAPRRLGWSLDYYAMVIGILFLPAAILSTLVVQGARAVGCRLVRWPRIAPGHCRACGYDLTGNVSGRCPECGLSRSTPHRSDGEHPDAPRY